MKEAQKEYIITEDLVCRVERALKFSGKNELAAEFGAIRNCFISHSSTKSDKEVQVGIHCPLCGFHQTVPEEEWNFQHLHGHGHTCASDKCPSHTYLVLDGVRDNVLDHTNLGEVNMSKEKRVNMGIPQKQLAGTARARFSGIPPILAILAILFIIAPISADLVKGTYYQILSVENPPQSNTTIFYYNNLTPQNDPKEWRVYPGDTLYLGGTYDLSYVSGTTKQFAWWKDWKYESTDCNPDVVNTVSYIDTNGRINHKMVYLDPELYKVGNWWQWDGCFVDRTSTSSEPKWLPYKADNNLAFRIIYPPVWPKPTPTPAPTPQQIFIPTPAPLPITTMPTINITPTETPVQKGGLPWQVYVGVGFVIVVIILGVLLL